MEKKLPGVFANKIEKELNNNERVYYSSNNTHSDDIRSVVQDERKDNSNQKVSLNINQKINNIFNSRRYVYKAEVNITTKDGVYIKKIIGQNSTHLITIENELIPISDIVDIDFAN